MLYLGIYNMYAASVFSQALSYMELLVDPCTHVIFTKKTQMSGENYHISAGCSFV